MAEPAYAFTGTDQRGKGEGQVKGLEEASSGAERQARVEEDAGPNEAAPNVEQRTGADAEAEARYVREALEEPGTEVMEGEEDEEDEGECGFCLYMKGGPCRESFIQWEECVEKAEKEQLDMVSACHKATFRLKECMEKNSDYYAPVLRAEKEMDEQSELRQVESEEMEAPAQEGNKGAEKGPDGGGAAQEDASKNRKIASRDA